jgi:hypothetical protein
MRLMHADVRKECCLTGETERLELHHILPRSQRGDDIRQNLVWLTAEKHRLVTANDEETLRALGEHIRTVRFDTQAYLTMKLGGFEQAAAWLRRRLYIVS